MKRALEQAMDEARMGAEMLSRPETRDVMCDILEGVDLDTLLGFDAIARTLEILTEQRDAAVAACKLAFPVLQEIEERPEYLPGGFSDAYNAVTEIAKTKGEPQ